MNYVEWLRARNVLRILAIVLGVLIVACAVLRISFNRELSNDTAFIHHVQMAPGAKVTHEVLPDGTPRTVVDDPADKTHMTIDDLGYGGRHIVITEPATSRSAHHSVTSIGSVKIFESRNGKMALTVIDTNTPVPFIFYMAFADVVALVIATLVAAPFARESDGHLEFALTKPVSRLQFALGIIGVNLATIVLSSVMTIVALIICQSMLEIPHFDFSGVNWQALLMGIALPFAWYALLLAATSSMRRGYGAVLGFAWPAALVIVAFSLIPWGDSLLGQSVHGIFWFISHFIPLTYANFSASGNAVHGSSAALAPNFTKRLSIELLLFVVYSALALLQWRRVEA